MVISLLILEDELLQLPYKIRAKQTDMAIRAAEIESQITVESKIRNEYLDPILSAINESTGKPIYSNEKSRMIALDKKLSEDKNYQELKNRLHSNQVAQRSDQIELEYFQNLFSAYKVIAGIKGVK